MITIATLLHRSTLVLADVSESPRLDAEVLLGHAAGISRTYLFAWPERELGENVIEAFLVLLEARTKGVPVAYLTGSREFWSREFAVTPDVLIPRPETELLVELALQAVDGMPGPRILDLGTGSGAIAITLAIELPLASLTAVEFSEAAMEVAQGNARRHGAGNIRFVMGDWFGGLDVSERYDLIVSNPPYIADGDRHLQQGDVRFEPAEALASGSDGLDDIRRIVAGAPSFLAPAGWLMCEHGYDQGAAVAQILLDRGFTAVATQADLAGSDRVSLGRWMAGS